MFHTMVSWPWPPLFLSPALVADQEVVAGIAVQLVIARSAQELVVAIAARGFDRNRRGTRIKEVVAGSALEDD